MRQICLSQRKVALVDEEDVVRVGKYRWMAMKAGRTFYAARYDEYRTYIPMHDFIMAPPAGFIADHINGNGLDNRRENLRLASSQQNAMNRTKTRAHSSRFKGVSFYKATGTWTAQLRINSKKIHLGYFDTEEAAATAYDEAAKVHFGEFAACGVQEGVT